MPSAVEELRDLAKKFWAREEIRCPKHPDTTMTGNFVQTTFADHIALSCPRCKETITIPQRPRQMQFHAQQTEGMVESLQRGDEILCYRCQAILDVQTKEEATTGITQYNFTCSRCFSYGGWLGRPESAKIGT